MKEKRPAIFAVALIFFLFAFIGFVFAETLEVLEHEKFDANNNVKTVTAGVSYKKILKTANPGIATELILWDPPATKKAVITDVILSTDAQNVVTLKQGTETILKWYLTPNQHIVVHFVTPIAGAVDADITITTTAGNTALTLTGYEEG